MNKEHWRQLDIVDMDKLKDKTVSIIGVGGIGSPVTIALAKMGIRRIDIYDNDTIEDHNIPNQFHLVNDIGKSKVKSLKKLTNALTAVTVRAIPKLYTDQVLNEIVIAATDSMSSRKTIYEQFMEQQQARFLIDSRMAGQYFNIFTVNKQTDETGKLYETTIIPDKDAIQLKCTEKAIIYNTLGIAAMVANIVKKYSEKEFDNIHFKYIFDYMSNLFQIMDREKYKKLIKMKN